MEWCYSLLFILLGLSFVPGASCAEEVAKDSQPLVMTSVVVVVGGIIALVVIVMVCTGQTKVNPSVRTRGPPDWCHSLVFKPELNCGFVAVSDGLHNETPFNVVRERLGCSITDAARWGVGLTEGKHVFEVHWPRDKNRGVSSCIGVGSADVPLKKQGRVSLIGEHSQSWGLDLPKMRTFHFNKVQQRLSLSIPDRFFMYLDMDAGKIGFGADVQAQGGLAEFFGFILTGIPKNPAKPMYVMISCCNPREQILVNYRGTAVPQGGFDLVGSLNPQALAAQQAVFTVPLHSVAVAPAEKPKKHRKHSSSSSSSDSDAGHKSHKMKY